MDITDMDGWAGYNSDEDRRRPAPPDTFRDALWGREQRESETIYTNPLYPRSTPVRYFSGQEERDEFHDEIAAWLEGGQV